MYKFTFITNKTKSRFNSISITWAKECFSNFSLSLPNISFARQYTLLPILRVLPDCILFPTKPSFLNSPALSPSLYLWKLIHLTFRKNTTPFSPNNPSNPPRIKVSAPATRRFRHAVGRIFYTTWQKYFHYIMVG